MTNQAYLKIYEDMACTKELQQGVNNDYIINVSVPTGHNSIDYKKNLYVSNVGTHTAYNVKITKTYDSSSKANVLITKNTIPSKDYTNISITLSYLKGETTNHQIQIKLEYDNIP